MTKFLLPPNDPKRAGQAPHRLARVQTPCPRRAVSEAPLSEAQRAALEASQARAATLPSLGAVAPVTARAVPRAAAVRASVAAGRQGWVCP